jgi:hypothetical protein
MFKVGDKVKMRSECSGALKGRIYTLIRRTGGRLTTDIGDGSEDSGCSCQHNWILIETKKIKEFGIVNFCRK